MKFVVPPPHNRMHYHVGPSRVEDEKVAINSSQSVLKASEIRNVFRCRWKAVWDDVLRIDLGAGGSTRPDPRQRNVALRTRYAAAEERLVYRVDQNSDTILVLSILSC